MSSPDPEPSRPRALRLLAVSMVLVWAVFPPETRGESMAASGALVVLLAALTWRSPTSEAGRTVLAALAVLAWPVGLASTAPGPAVEWLATACLAGALGLLLAAHGPSLRETDMIPSALAAVGVLVGVMAVHQVLWGLDAAAARVDAIAVPDRDLVLARLGQGRAFAAFATPAALGGFMALVLPITVGLARDRSGRSRALAWTAAAIQAVGLVLTVSVTAVAALLAGIAMLAWRQPGRRRAMVAAATLAAAALAVAVGTRAGEIFDRDRWDSPWRLRAGNYRVALAVIADHPWIGVGPGGFGETFPAYRGEGDNETRHVHDLPLELMAEWGIVPGGLAAVGLAVLFVGPVLRRRPEPRAWQRGAAVGLAAFAVHNLVDFTAFFPSLLWSAVLVRATLARGAIRAEGRVRGSAAVVLAATAVAAGIVALGGLSWNTRYHARLAAAGGDVDAGVRLTRRAARLAPWNVDARSLHAQALLERDGGSAGPDVARALAHAEAAVRLSPVRPSARELRARVRVLLDDTPGAYADLVEAVRLYPLNERYRILRDDLAGRLPVRPDLREDPP